MAAGTCVYAEVAVVKVGAATEIELNERKRRIERAVRNGLNAATGQYVDRVKDGIVEPAKVTRCALQSARNAPAPHTIGRIRLARPRAAAGHLWSSLGACLWSSLGVCRGVSIGRPADPRRVRL